MMHESAAYTKWLQGGILKHHGRDYCAYWSLKLKPEASAEDKLAFVSYLGSIVTSQEKQSEASATVKAGKYSDKQEEPFFISVGLTYSAYNSIGIPKRDRPTDDYWGKSPNQVCDDIGLYHFINDKTKSGIERGDKLALKDFLVTIAHSFRNEIDCKINEIRKDYRYIAAIANFSEDDETSQDVRSDLFFAKKTGEGNERVGPLGFADGISNPVGLKEKIEASLKIEKRKFPMGEYAGIQDAHYGSFGVFMEIVVNEKGFEKAVTALMNEGVKYNKKQAEAMFIGRHKKGAPLAYFEEDVEPGFFKIGEEDLPFSHGEGGNKCPFHAHARRMRLPEGGKQVMLRRGMNMVDEKSQLTGLCFMSFQHSLGDFIKVLDRISGPDGYSDAILYPNGKGNEVELTFPKSYNKANENVTIKVEAGQISSIKGAMFLYYPSVYWLQHIAISNYQSELTDGNLGFFSKIIKTISIFFKKL